MPLDEPPTAAPPPPPVTRQGILILSVALYLASLALPVMREVGMGAPPNSGLSVLALGWLGVLSAQFGWLANLFWVIGAYCLHRRRWTAAAITSSVAVLVAADTFRMYATGMVGDSGAKHDVRLLAGFYVWWASMWVLSAGAWVLLERHRPPMLPARAPSH